MLISSVNNSFISFKGQRRLNDNTVSKNVTQPRSPSKAKILLPAIFLLAAPALQSNTDSDTFTKNDIPIEFNDITSTKIASVLNISTQDFYIKRALKDKTITIDPGHGGTNREKTTFSKPYGAQYYDYKNKKWVYEKNITLKIAKEVERLLKQAGANIVMTRDSDNYVTLDERAKTAKDVKSDMFISIHVNANPSSRAHGPEIYARSSGTKTEPQKDTKELAKYLNTRLTKIYNIEEEKILYKGFNVLEDTKEIPGVLVETGYLTNPSDRKVLLSEEGQMKLAQEIAGAITEFWVQKQFNDDTADFMENANYLAENVKK